MTRRPAKSPICPATIRRSFAPHSANISSPCARCCCWSPPRPCILRSSGIAADGSRLGTLIVLATVVPLLYVVAWLGRGAGGRGRAGHPVVDWLRGRADYARVAGRFWFLIRSLEWNPNMSNAPTLGSLLTAYWTSQSIYVAAKLGLSDLLYQEPANGRPIGRRHGYEAGAALSPAACLGQRGHLPRRVRRPLHADAHGRGAAQRRAPHRNGPLPS